MITRQNGRKTFYQWDLDQQLVLTEIEGDLDVHFWQEGQSEALVVEPTTEDDLALVAVPNILLQNALPIKVYIWRKDIGAWTAHQQIFQVLEREKPADYVYTETETKRWEDVAAKADEALETVNDLEKRADNGEFKGPPGPEGPQGKPGEQGPPGEAGHTPQKGVDYFTEADKAELVKQLKPKKVLFTNGATITAEDNTLYYADTEISSLTIIYPETDFICSFDFTIADKGDVTITLPESKYIGGTPSFANGETWEVNIKNGVVVGGLVE